MAKAAALSDRQLRFVAEYAVDGNGTQAAIRAGYAPSGAEVQAHRLLSDAKIVMAVEAAKAKVQIRTDVTVDRVLRELALIAFSNHENYRVNGDGRLVLAEGAPPEAMRAVSSVDYELHPVLGKVTKVKLRLWNKVAANDLIGKYFGMWAEKQGEAPAGPEFIDQPAKTTLAEASRSLERQLSAAADMGKLLPMRRKTA